MALGFSLGSQVISTEAATKMTKDMATARWFGLTALATKESGSRAFSMDSAQCRSQTVGRRKVGLKITSMWHQPRTLNK